MVHVERGYAGARTKRRVCLIPLRPCRFRMAATLIRLTVAGLLLLVSGHARATVFLYHISDDEILVGADSFLEIDGVEQAPKAVKIHQIGSLFYAIQGKSRIGDTKLVDLVSQAKNGPDQMIDNLEFPAFFQQMLTRWLVENRRVRPDLYQPYASNGIVMTALQLFGFRQGKPFMETLEFFTVGRGTTVAIRKQHMKFTPGQPAWIPAGVWTQGNPATDFIPTKDPVNHMRYLFDREFRAEVPRGRSKLARPPLDILRISPAGAEWIQRKPECPEIQPYAIPVN